jgi:hypothetical protein
MWIPNHGSVGLIAAILSVTFVQAQLNFPNCINKCIDQSTDDSCKITDVKCICRESNGESYFFGSWVSHKWY